MNHNPKLGGDEHMVHIAYSTIEQVQIFVIHPLIFLAALIVMVIQLRDRRNSMKNYRFYFHLMLGCMMVTVLCQILNVAYLRDIIEEFYLFKMQYIEPKQSLLLADIGCTITGVFNVLFEVNCFIRLVWFSYIVKRMVTSPTSNFKMLSIISHITTYTLSISFILAVYFIFGFSISSTLTCGIALSSEKTYSDFIRCWPIIFLPFCIYNFIFLQLKVPSLIKSSVKYFIFQYSFYVIFFTLYVVTRFLYLVLFLNFDPSTSYFELSNQKLYIAARIAVLATNQLQMCALIFVIGLSNDHIDKLKHCCKRGKSHTNSNLDDNQLIQKTYSNFTDEIDQNDMQQSQEKTKLGMFNGKKKIDTFVTDEQFKANYNSNVLKKQSTLVLKTSFHTINVILMGMCQVFKNIRDSVSSESASPSNTSLKQKINESIEHEVSISKFMTENNDLTIYDIEEDQIIQIVEYAPQIFKDLRKKCGVTNDILFQSFAPIHNFQAIHNFFTGSGKSSSFFFFTDNKTFVLKTLKESEKKLLLEQGVLDNYYTYVMGSKQTLLSEYYGVYTIRVQNMQEINCVVMDNLLGKDFYNITRIYDLKGSTKNRKVKLSQQEQHEGSGLRVLKDLNFIDIKEKLDIPFEKKQQVLDMIEKDALFLSQNNLMDYSVLFIKKKDQKVNEQGFRRMPAIVFVKNKDGTNQLQLREVDDDNFQKIVLKRSLTKVYVPGLTAHRGRQDILSGQVVQSAIQSVDLNKQNVNSQNATIQNDEGMDEELGKEYNFEDEEEQHQRYKKANDGRSGEISFKSEFISSSNAKNSNQNSNASFFSQVENRILQNVQSYLMNTNFKSALKENATAESIDQEFTYRVGVIDFLTAYNAAKKMETTWNSMIHWTDREKTSCQAPQTYAERFVTFLNEQL